MNLEHNFRYGSGKIIKNKCELLKLAEELGIEKQFNIYSVA